MFPNSGYQYYRVSGTAAGTTVIKASETILHAVVIGETKTGTVTFYDSATAAGAVAAVQLFTLQNTAGSVPQNVICDGQMKKGITVVVGGTTDMTVFYK
jgi:hypothetical protein